MMKTQRCKHGMIPATCGLCLDPLGPHERHYGDAAVVHRPVVGQIEEPEEPKEEENIMVEKCEIEVCQEDAVARGLGMKCYKKWRRGEIEHPRLGKFVLAGVAKVAKAEAALRQTHCQQEEESPATPGPPRARGYLDLPDELWERLVKCAEAQYRNPGQQILWYIDRGVSVDEMKAEARR